jgi:hypothetical protein
MAIIREAKSPQDMETVWRLTHDMYVAQGYAQVQPNGLLVHYPHLDAIPQTIIWIAEDENGRALGTLSYTDDGPAGLHVDDDFKDVTDAVREECRRSVKRLGASWRIVTQPECRNGLDVVMGLITRYVEYIKLREIDVTLYTFNPKHGSFYKRMLDFEIIAEPRIGHAVQAAPAILMRGELARVVARWRKIMTRRDSARRQAVELVHQAD